MEEDRFKIKKKIVGVDGLRAIACLMVIVHHLAGRLRNSIQIESVREWQRFFKLGHFGVVIFFVLSGMLLSYPFWSAYFSKAPFPSIKIYLIRRAARIVPGFYLSLFLSFILGNMIFGFEYNSTHWLRLFSGLTFTSSFHHITFFPVEANGPLWSIGFEVVCYFLMPFFMFLLFKLSPSRSVGFAFFFWITVLFIMIALHIIIIKIFVLSNQGKGYRFGLIGLAKSMMPEYNPVGFFIHFLFGIFGGYFVSLFSLKAKIIEKLEYNYFFDVLSIGSLMLALFFLWTIKGNSQAVKGLGQMQYAFPYFTLLITCCLTSLPFSLYVGKFFDNFLLAYTAKVSFGLYIYHVLVMEITALIFPHFQYSGLKSVNELICFSGFIIIISYVV